MIPILWAIFSLIVRTALSSLSRKADVSTLASFQKKYGHFVGAATPSGYGLTAAWQSGLQQGAGCGSILGTIINGWLIAAFGPRKVLLCTLTVMTCFLFIVFFAPNKPILLVGEILLGFEWGIFATTAPAYASEVLPIQLRVYFTSYTNMCFIIGQFISAGVLRGLVGRSDQWGYRIPFAIQWIWPAFLIPLIFFAPESELEYERLAAISDIPQALTTWSDTTGSRKLSAPSVASRPQAKVKIRSELSPPSSIPITSRNNYQSAPATTIASRDLSDAVLKSQWLCLAVNWSADFASLTPQLIVSPNWSPSVSNADILQSSSKSDSTLIRPTPLVWAPMLLPLLPVSSTGLP
jgi:MFS family permease